MDEGCIGQKDGFDKKPVFKWYMVIFSQARSPETKISNNQMSTVEKSTKCRSTKYLLLRK
jgi:hypothetical protein